MKRKKLAGDRVVTTKMRLCRAWGSQDKGAAAELQAVTRRVRALEEAVRRLEARLSDLEAVETRVRTALEQQRIDAEIAPIEAATMAKKIEAEVKAHAALIEATTPHYPRA